MVKLDKILLSSTHPGFANELPIITFSMTLSGGIDPGFRMFQQDIPVGRAGLMTEMSYRKQGSDKTYYAGQSNRLIDVIWGSNVWLFSGYINPSTIRVIIFVNGVGGPSPTPITPQTYDFRLFIFSSPLNT